MTDISFELDGRAVSVPDDGSSLLEVLRERLAVRSLKDGCSPQGQCGCCTVLVDGQPRVACVTPARRVAGRRVTTVDGIGEEARRSWADALVATGGSQCGFCTPGIVLRLHATSSTDARRALAAHLCRCTGWQTIVEAVEVRGRAHPARDLDAATRRATIESGGRVQQVGPHVPLGGAGFADDTAPDDALVAVPTADGGYAVGATLAEARRAAGKVQGRRTTIDLRHPVEVPVGPWDLTLRTTWVEPAYLETDASWCAPGGAPASPLANAGAFGGKSLTPVMDDARRLADEHGRPVRVVWSREDVVRRGHKRPPVAGGVRADGTGEIAVVRTDGIADAITASVPGLRVTEVDVPGPPTSRFLRAAGWAEAAVLVAAARGEDEITSPSGARASAHIDPATGALRVRVSCGDPLDEVVLRSYCIGAAHMALGWVRSEGIAVDDAGEVHDLTIRSFGIVRPQDMPHVDVDIDASSGGEPVDGGDAVFAAVALAAWRAAGLPPQWPTDR